MDGVQHIHVYIYLYDVKILHNFTTKPKRKQNVVYREIYNNVVYGSALVHHEQLPYVDKHVCSCLALRWVPKLNENSFAVRQATTGTQYRFIPCGFGRHLRFLGERGGWYCWCTGNSYNNNRNKQKTTQKKNVFPHENKC